MSEVKDGGRDEIRDRLNAITNEQLATRLRELSDAVTLGERGRSEFTMSIPVNVERDADIILDEAARRLAARNGGEDAKG